MMENQTDQKDQKSPSANSHSLVDPESSLTVGADNEQPNPSKENVYLDMIKDLKRNLAQKNNECEILKIKLDESARVINCINQELNKCKFTVFEMNQDSVRNKERSIKLKNLEQRYAKLTNDFVAMGEDFERSKAKLFDKYIDKSNAINHHELWKSNEYLRLRDMEAQLESTHHQLTLLKAQKESLTLEVARKDEILEKFKQSMQDLQTAYQQKIDDLNAQSLERGNKGHITTEQQIEPASIGCDLQDPLPKEIIKEDESHHSEIGSVENECLFGDSSSTTNKL